MRVLIEPIARDISPTITGKEFSELDTVRDAAEIVQVCRAATIVRYLRAGVKVTWVSAEEMEFCKQFVPNSEGSSHEDKTGSKDS